MEVEAVRSVEEQAPASAEAAPTAEVAASVSAETAPTVTEVATIIDRVATAVTGTASVTEAASVSAEGSTSAVPDRSAELTEGPVGQTKRGTQRAEGTGPTGPASASAEGATAEPTLLQKVYNWLMT